MALHRAWTSWPRGLAVGLLLWISAAVAAEAQQIQVTAADPPAAEQGTVNLNVSIKGKGFKKGAVASFALTGTEDPDGIVVNSTSFVSATTLVANITVADTATIAKFDIKVRNSDGRIGKGTELFAVLAKGSSTNTGPQSPVRALFANTAGLRIRSDGQTTPCGYDYVHFTDPCTGLVDSTGTVVPNPEQATASTGGGQLWLRMVPGCCIPAVNEAKVEWESYVAAPSRWLVLDFSSRVNGSPCLDIDREIADAVGTTNWSALTTADGSPLPTPVPPAPNPDRCVDHVNVRFQAGHAFTGDGTTGLNIQIDEPQAVSTRVKGKKSSKLQWNARYSLVFLLPLLATPDASGNIILQPGGCGDCDLAELREADGTVIGTYHMPFSLTLRPAE